MCGAYGFSADNAEKVSKRFAVKNVLTDFKPRWNLRPGEMNPVVLMQEDVELKYMFWTLIPHWSKDRKVKFSTFNARADGLMKSSVYKQPFLHKRCLIPATGFYEPDKEHFSKPPYPWHYFQLKDQEIFSFAGLYDIWKDPQTGDEVYSYTLITTDPNGVVGQWHNRSPVIFQSREEEQEWLNPDITESEQLMPLLRPYPDEKMEQWEVGAEARNPRNDYPELIHPVGA